MKRHLTDQTILRDAALRMREFLRIEREGMLHPSVRSLGIRQTDAPANDGGIAQFLRIERGIEA